MSEFYSNTMMESGEDGGYSPMHDTNSGEKTTPAQNNNHGDGSGYADMSSAARAAMLLRLGAGGDGDDFNDDEEFDSGLQEITTVDHTGTHAHNPSTTSVTTKKESAEDKPLALWKLCRDHDTGQLRLLLTPEPEAEGERVEVEVLMPPLKKRIAMNLSLSEQPHNGIFVNGSRIEGEPLVGTKGTEFEWGEGAGRTDLKIMATKKVRFDRMSSFFFSFLYSLLLLLVCCVACCLLFAVSCF